MYREVLTGSWYYKKSFFGGCFWVQVEVYTYCDFDGTENPPIKDWRKADLADLRLLEIFYY